MTFLALRNRKASAILVVILAATVLMFMGVEFTSRSEASANRDSNANTGANSTKPANHLALPTGTSYTWIGGTPAFTTDWQVSANWSPARTAPDPADVLMFNAGSPTVTNVPTQTIAELDLTGGALVTLNAATIPSGDKTLTISGGGLSVAAGTSLTLAASTALTISVAPATTGTISGQIILQDAGHRVQASDANGIKFQNGSILTTSTGFSGNPFGAGTDGSIEFTSGASSFFNAGGDPFGGPGHSIATFDPGSSQTFNAASAFSYDGRSYGNLTLDGNQSYSGGSATNPILCKNNLSIAAGSSVTLPSSPGGDLILWGDLTVNATPASLDTNGRTVRFQGGNTIQNVTTAGTFGDVSILKTGGSVKLGDTLTINGALQFDGVSPAVVDVLELNSKTLNLNGTVGGTSNSTSNGFKGDSTGATLNIGGTGALFGTLRFVSGAQALTSLTVNRASSATVTLGTGLVIGDSSTGSVTLANGVISTGTNTLLLRTAASITGGTNGYVIGSLEKNFGPTGLFTFTVGTANGYSPVDANVTSGGGGFLTVKALQGKHPAISDGTTALQRYWSLLNFGITADLTFHYLGTDVMGTEANYKVVKYSDGNFTQFTPNALNTGTHTAQLLGVSAPTFSDWTLAQGWQVQFNASNYNTGEGDSGAHPVTITVQRVGGTTGPASVHWATTDGSATAGSDYVAASGDLSWANGDGADKTFAVTVNGDTVYEANETVNLTLSGATGGVSGGTNPATLTIFSDDLPPATLTVNTTDDVDNGFCLASHCSLREAINAANLNADTNTINFDPAVFASPGPYTISLLSALPNLTTDMIINGPGASVLTVQRSTAGGTPKFRVFTISSGKIVSLSGLTITNGRTADGPPGTGFGGGQGGNGGGLLNNGTLALTDLIITGNRTGDGGPDSNSGGGFGGFGAGIYSEGSLTMTNVTVSNNTAGNSGLGSYGGAGGRGGGIYFNGTILNMTNSLVTGNTGGNAIADISGGSGAGGYGGGVYLSAGSTSLINVAITANNGGNALVGNGSGGGGGGIFNFGVQLTMTNCTVSGNGSGQGGNGFAGAGGLGGGIFNASPMNAIGCTVSNNFTRGPSSGGQGLGGGIFNGSQLTMSNSTISGNSTHLDSGRGGGIYNNVSSTITLSNCTVTGNSAYTCCSFQNGQGINNNGTANVANTIISGNGNGSVPDVTGNFTSQGHNLIGRATIGPNGGSNGDESGFTNGSNGDQVGTLLSPLDPLLGPLANNGGLTQTHALLPGSPAIDAGNNSFITNPPFSGPPFTDQRGPGFPRISNTTVDIGAFESRGFTIAASGGTPQSTPILSAFGLPLVATVSSALGEPVGGGVVTFTAPASGASGTFPGSVITAAIATNGSGVAASPTFTANGAVGPYNVVASIGASLPTAIFALTNDKGNQTITFNPNPLPDKLFSDPDFLVNATASSGLPVSFVATGNCTVGGNTVHLTSVGSCTITAQQAGNDTFNPAPDVVRSFNIAKGNQTITFAGPGPGTYGNLPFNVSATASSNLPVSFSIFSGPATISGNTVTLTGAGTVIVRASQAGDSNYNAAPNVDASFSVAQATTSTSVSSSINPSDLGQGVTFTATVSSSAGTPTGTVQFTDGSNNLGGPINCVAGGGNTCTAQFSTSSLSSGNHAIAASYSGDTNFAGNSGALSGGQVVTNQPALLLILDESGPDANQAAAFDSLLFVRDPFHVQSVASWLDLGADRNTRVMIFAANLQLNQGETASAVVVSLVDANNQSFDAAAEDVRVVPNFGFAQVRFRLPDNLTPGVCLVTVKAHGQISNTGTIRIVSP
jgi:CSLREA domain-containing protein